MKAKKAKSFKEDICALCNAHRGNNKAAAHWYYDDKMLNLNDTINRFNVFQRCWKPPGNTRWWAERELLIFLMENFEDVATFCATADDDGDMEK